MISRIKFRAAAAVLILSAALTSCGIPDMMLRIRGYNGEYQVKVVTDVNDIEDNSFYIKKQDGYYYKPYVGENSFIGGRSSGANILWFGKDYDMIPTMNKGDSLVYRSSQEFSPDFLVSRFQDMGYTIGICNMTPTSAGRYAFSTDTDDRCININSSAGELYALGSHYVTMEMIGDAQLRKGNISQAGTIIGLDRGKTYKADVYIGTEVLEYKFVADVRAMMEMDMERYIISDFEYEKNKVVSFKFPDYFNSGYYLISDFGVVKYVNSDKEYDESMAMNIPNPSGPPDEEDESASYQTAAETKESVPFVVDKAGLIEVSVRFEAISGTTDRTEELEEGNRTVRPTGRVIGESGSYTLNLTSDGTALAGTFELEPGKYNIEITGLAGRNYSYLVRKADTQENE